MIPLFEPQTGWTPLGLPMSQNRLSIPTWSYAMEKYPPRTIVEIGTNSGGFTCAIGIHAWRIGAQIHTFDTCESPTEAFRPLSNILPITFHREDCFWPGTVEKIADLIRRPGVTYLLCDGGNKVREFNHFSHFLKDGDVIAAHDYSVSTEWWPWNEITFNDVRETALKNGLYSFMQNHFDVAGWLAFQKGNFYKL